MIASGQRNNTKAFARLPTLSKSSKTKRIKGVSFERNCGAASVGVLQDNLVLSTELTKRFES